MNPEFRSVMRRRVPRILLALLLAILAGLCWKIIWGGGLHIPPLVNLIESVADDVVPEPPPAAILAPPVPPEPVEEWVVTTANNVLFWPTVGGECQQRGALMQVHKGEKALVLSRQGAFVEVALNNLSLPHTRGCIHESLLVPEDG